MNTKHQNEESTLNNSEVRQEIYIPREYIFIDLKRKHTFQPSYTYKKVYCD
jgi:hypothetical protein